MSIITAIQNITEIFFQVSFTAKLTVSDKKVKWSFQDQVRKYPRWCKFYPTCDFTRCAWKERSTRWCSPMAPSPSPSTSQRPLTPDDTSDTSTSTILVFVFLNLNESSTCISPSGACWPTLRRYLARLILMFNVSLSLKMVQNLFLLKMEKTSHKT